MSVLTRIDLQKPTYIFRFNKVKQIPAAKHTITAYICIYLHISAFACIDLECLKSWERAGLAQVDEVREVDELLKALEKWQVHI